MAPTCADVSLDDVSAVLFDLDNTLISTRKADQRAIGKALTYLCSREMPEKHAKLAVDKFYQCLRMNPEDPVKDRYDLDSWRTLLWALALGPDRADLASDVYPLWKTARFAHIRFEPDVIDLLAQLRPRYKLALITNGPSSAQWEKVTHLGAADMFDAIFVGGDYAEQKPCASIFQLAFSVLDVEPHECVMVGDTLATDIQGGLNAGVAATIWLPLPLAMTMACDDLLGDEPPPEPDFTIKHLREILSILRVNGGGACGNNGSSSASNSGV